MIGDPSDMDLLYRGPFILKCVYMWAFVEWDWIDALDGEAHELDQRKCA